VCEEKWREEVGVWAEVDRRAWCVRRSGQKRLVCEEKWIEEVGV
jgi:hypothetical protein